MVFSLTSTASHELFDRFLLASESPETPGDHSAVNDLRPIIPEVFLRLGDRESPHRQGAVVHVHDRTCGARSSSASTELDRANAAHPDPLEARQDVGGRQIFARAVGTALELDLALG